MPVAPGGAVNGMNEERAKRWLSEAEGYLELGLLAQARERVEAVAKTGHLAFECAVLLGNLHREKNEHPLAIPHFEAALKLRRGDILATVGLGWSLKRTGCVDRAAAAYEEALKVHPDEGLLHYNLACYRCLQGQAQEALKELQRAVSLDDDYRLLAREESDFDPIKQTPEFQKSVAGGPGASQETPV